MAETKSREEAPKRNRIKPQIFIPEEGKDSLIDVLLETDDSCDLFWFHWPHDGFSWFGEDFEPIIIVYDKDNNILCIVTRRHWQYTDYDTEDCIGNPPEILFETSFHAPLPKTQENKDIFENKVDALRLIRCNYDPKLIPSSQISLRYRVGQGHPTAIFGQVEDPHDVVKRILDEYFT